MYASEERQNISSGSEYREQSDNLVKAESYNGWNAAEIIISEAFFFLS